MQVKNSLKKLIVVITCLYIVVSLCVPISASENTVTITGQDLYNLLVSGRWTASITLGSDSNSTLTLDNGLGMSVSLSDNGICAASFYFKVDDYIGSVTTDYIHSPNIKFATSSAYSGVADFDVTIGGSTSFSITHSGGVANNQSMLSDFGFLLFNGESPVGTASAVSTTYESSKFTYYYPSGSSLVSATQSVLLYNAHCSLDSSSDVTGFNIYTNQNNNLDFTTYSGVSCSYVCTTFTVTNITVTCSSSSSAGDIKDDLDDAASDVAAAIKAQTGVQEKFYSNMLTPTDADNIRLDDQQQAFDDVQAKVDDYNEAKDSVDTPEAEDVIADDAVDTILQDENIVAGQSYVFSILKTLQGVTWILTMILISVTVGVIKFIIYGKT